VALARTELTGLLFVLDIQYASSHVLHNIRILELYDKKVQFG